MSFRLVICIDVEDATSIEDAYEQVYKQMAKIDTQKFGWESTDEAFGPDGEPIDEDDLSTARCNVIERQETFPDGE